MSAQPNTINFRKAIRKELFQETVVINSPCIEIWKDHYKTGVYNKK